MNRYQTIPYRRVEDKKVTSTTIYPEVALSEQFYGSSDYWWIIASCNPHIRRDTLYITPGAQIRIPPYRIVKEAFEQLNRTR